MSDDSPTEQIHEDIQDKALEARESWISWPWWIDFPET